MTDLIIGAGEVGTALYDVLSETYDVKIRDKEDTDVQDVRYLHICYPYKKWKSFICSVNSYIKQYNPRITIVHSTVQVGVTDQLTVSAVHSPIIGLHRKQDDPPERPSMQQCLRTFSKWVAGKGSMEIADYFNKAGIKSAAFVDPKITEAAKLMSTTTYGLHIAWAQEMERFCKLLNIPYETAVMSWNGNYSEGYIRLGLPQYHRPILYPGHIGGHCVMPNIDILEEARVSYRDNPNRKRLFEWTFLDAVKQSNAKKKKSIKNQKKLKQLKHEP